jgi:hypothetical protein
MTITLEQVKKRMEQAFSPDMTCTWQGKSTWLFSPQTKLGEEFCRLHKGVIMKSFLVGNSTFEEIYNSMLACGLTVESVGGPDEE